MLWPIIKSSVELHRHRNPVFASAIQTRTKSNEKVCYVIAKTLRSIEWTKRTTKTDWKDLVPSRGVTVPLGPNVINKLKHSLTTQCWSEALWLDGPTHVTTFNQSFSFISTKHNYARINIDYDLGTTLWIECFNLGSRKSRTQLINNYLQHFDTRTSASLKEMTGVCAEWQLLKSGTNFFSLFEIWTWWTENKYFLPKYKILKYVLTVTGNQI